MGNDHNSKLSVNELGLNAKRGCTDIICFPLFLAAWALLVFIGYVAFNSGDLQRLIYGADFLGNLCGRGSPTLINSNDTFAVQGGDVPWSSRTKLWFPITLKVNGEGFGFFTISQSLQQGICVSACPQAGELLNVYRLPNATLPVEPYVVLFNSKDQFQRCIPDLTSFECAFLTVGRSECERLRNITATPLGRLFDSAQGAFDELRGSWWILLSCFGISIVVCFLWMFILRRTVKPVVVVTLVALLAALGVLGYLLFSRYRDMNAQGLTDARYYLAGAIGAWVVAVIFLALVVFLFRDIMVACDIIEEAAKVPIKMPSMMISPLLSAVWALGVVVLCSIGAALIYTAATTATVRVPLPSFSGVGRNTTMEAKSFEFVGWRAYAIVYDLLVLLWSIAFLGGASYLSLSMCATFWYWSVPGDDKAPQAGLGAAIKTTMRYHLGTVAFGSLIIAIVRLIRILLNVFEKRFRAMQGTGAGRFLLCCANCCLACLDRFVSFVSKNAFVVCGMVGTNFIASARTALSLLTRNVTSVAAVTIIGEYVMIMSKVFITTGVLAACYGILYTQKKSLVDGWLTLVVVGILAYAMATLFLDVLEVCIDTLLIAYCYDIVHHNGTDRPYFFPSDLAKHVEGAKKRMAEAAQKGTDLDEPLQSKTPSA